MIITSIFSTVIVFVNGIIGLIPTLPQFPTAFTNALDWLSIHLVTAIIIFKYLFGETFFNVTIVAVIALLTFEYTYHLVMWVARKIPFLGVK